MKNLEGEIEELQATLDAKRQQHNCFEQEHNLGARIKHPVRVLPPEVLGHIFAFAVGDPPFNRFIDVARLRAVCSSWRGVALTTPGLWTSLTVNVQ
ncbi:hypothetical protein BKA70DRAFT_1098750, partial [Coprinopsis sp. MPI-PUGE-AT-0042]